MCLLVVAFHLIPDTPLLIGANRDEFVSRPAVTMTVLRHQAPRILGGQDLASGGTWLAINERGVFAGLTNQPQAAGRDPTRRSRGELPLALTSHADAPGGVDDFLCRYQPADYNGSWLLVGDRDALFYIDFTGSAEPTAVALAPGLHVLENRPLGIPSAKVDHVARSLDTLTESESAVAALQRVPADHLAAAPPGGDGTPRSSANCVHLDGYGTRSSCIVRVGEDRRENPQVWVADGAPCTTPFIDVTELWSAATALPS